MNKTENLKLNVWEKTDPILVGDFNEDNRKIDAEIHALKMQPTFKVVTGSYVGNGKYGRDNPNRLTFDFKPKLVYVTNGYGTFMIAGENVPNWKTSPLDNGSYSMVHITWSGNGLEWWNETNADYQLNFKNTYYYFAIG